MDDFYRKRSKSFCLKTTEDFDVSELIGILDGVSTAYISPNFISGDFITTTIKKFWNSDGLANREDADASFVGSYHFGKSLEDYLRQTGVTRKFVDELSVAAGEPIEKLIRALRVQLEARGESLRPAAHSGIEANSFVMRSWQYEGEYSLDPHEDAAQLCSASQRGFEVQNVEGPLVSVNICFENGVGGDLRIWNFKPDEDDREVMGTTERGYPYTEDRLASEPSVNIVVSPGDIYCFDAKYVHAVRSPLEKNHRRTTMAVLIARLDRSNFIYWT